MAQYKKQFPAFSPCGSEIKMYWILDEHNSYLRLAISNDFS